MRKISGLLLLIPLFVLAILGTPVSAPGIATISIDPSGTVGLAIGESFPVAVMISDVENLAGYEFHLSYDASVLTTSVDDVTVVTDWFGPDVEIWLKKVDDTAGDIWLIVTLPLGTVMGVFGTGTIVTVTFTVEGEALAVLDLNNCLLGDPLGRPIIKHVVDGVFANVPLPQLWIKDKGAQGGGMWPDWHVAAPGTPQTLYARIVNTGDVGCYIRVKVGIYNIMAGDFPEMTNEDWIPPKEAHNVTRTLTTTFLDTHTVGVYYVSGTIEFSLDNTLWVQYSALEDVIGGRGTTRDVPGNDATKFKTH